MTLGRRAVLLAATLSLTGLVAAGCSNPLPPPDPRLHPAWQEVNLPVPPGQRAVIRGSAACADRWYLTGSTATPAGEYTPAAWTSTDLHTWTTIPINPVSFYGKQNTISITGCQVGHMAALGWQTGGAHGFPRYSGWYPDAAGTLQEVDIPYTLYAGPEGVNVAGIATSDRGFVLTGNRVNGAAAWHSTNGEKFTVVSGAPNLASTREQDTWATGVAATPTGWIIVGAVTPVATGNRDPAVWTSPDAVHWTPVPVPASPSFEDPQRVVVMGSTVVTIGIRDNGYAVWRGTTTGGWARIAQFGTNGGGHGSVSSLVVANNRLLTALSDENAYTVWESDDQGASWQPVALPGTAPNSADTRTILVSDQRQLLLVIDDGRSSRVWLDPAATAGR